MGDLARAITDYDRALHLNPRLTEAYIDRGKAYGKLNNPVSAMADFDQALDLDPKLGRAYYFRAVAYWQLGQNEQACLNLQQACKFGLCDNYHRAQDAGICP
jgi:tetratricopeptide (TPR) repeat protein